jgi:hypothetical protein
MICDKETERLRSSKSLLFLMSPRAVELRSWNFRESIRRGFRIRGFRFRPPESWTGESRSCRRRRRRVCMQSKAHKMHARWWDFKARPTLSLSLSPPLRFPTLTPSAFSSFFPLLISQIQIIIERLKRIERNNRNIRDDVLAVVGIYIYNTRFVVNLVVENCSQFD